ncbi:FAD-dependent oxidoreductase [Pacificimonas sp. WHA3]|uniref:FAD-dependent oxidoreductase n=1 Tax=Pacificimonas pallii TaxID=2827236 RepID=A0ABS6SCD1_9SPHN|nr:FAD-dependent oxidoreductase [Pacificimonas pallii]MBV7256070.1 FAD-dependent oxidoreductase [Pacificimonas pallii]
METPFAAPSLSGLGQERRLTARTRAKREASTISAELDQFDIAIVGAGHAGAQAAIALRGQGYEGRIGLIGDEPDLPYERPPLSKEYLAGEKPFERMLLRKESFWEERDIRLLPSTRIERVDARTHELFDAEGESIRYGKLIWAGGGEPRRMPCGSDAGLSGVHAIRTHADVQLLRKELAAADRIVVVGGGYIGLEAAAVLTRLGKHVTVVEAATRLLSRVCGAPISDFYERLHRAAGVEFRLNTMTDCLEGEDHHVRGVRLSCGESLPADLVIIGIGIVPSIEPLTAAGIDTANGVRVDAQCRTSDPDIFAIGDCALHVNAWADSAEIRLESVQNANDMAKVAAQVITGTPAHYDALPWFWSNQYDVKLQTAGLSMGYDDHVLRGSPDEGSFSMAYLKAGRIVALDAVNRPADFVQAQKLIRARASPSLAALADIEMPLKTLIPTS